MQTGPPYDAKQNRLGLIVGMVRCQDPTSSKRLSFSFKETVARVARRSLAR
jgi:hypothetical protein